MEINKKSLIVDMKMIRADMRTLGSHIKEANYGISENIAWSVLLRINDLIKALEKKNG